MERIDIFVPEKVLAENEAKKARLERTRRFEAADRTPVVVDAQLWALLHGSGGSFRTMIQSPRDHLRTQILNQKWRIESIRDDRPIPTEGLVIESEFGALRGTEFPLEIIWNGEEPAKVKHLIQSPEEIDHLAIPEPYSGLAGQRANWYRAMSELVQEFDVRLNGDPLPLKIDLTHPGGPFPSAFALCGSNIFLWMKTDPERVHRLMEITTRSHLQVIAYYAEVTGRDPGHSVWLGADTAEMVRPEMFREFIAPYYLRVWEQHKAPRVFHMCGKIDHLLTILRDDLQISFLDGFGFPVSRERLAETLAGRVVLRGGPHPVLVHDGPVEAIIATCSEYIRTVGNCGGYILSDGSGLMAGTPLAHIDAMVAASKLAANE